ncbi:MAG: molybdopterin-dependent oxidoreductase [Desulfobulbaceae bacterium]|nr:molybdopterin-dependent oxidoreductase [Desulfobulbaceae bacterium]
MKEEKHTQKNSVQDSTSRRFFLKGAVAATAGIAALGSKKSEADTNRDWKNPRSLQKGALSQLDEGIRVTHSVCLGCNARCGNRIVVKDGMLENISGNPYNPYNTHGNPVEYTTPVNTTLGISSPVCAKAIDAPNYAYNPYRLLKPLKRAGKRGEGKFEPIEWEQLIREVSQGGRLFAHLGEKREIEGLKALDSDEPIDPAAPELGPRRNGFVLMTGRLQTGRKAFIDRFVKTSMGSVNRIGHTDICGLGFRMGNYAFTDKKQVELKADPWGAEYILVFGANIYEALQPGINTYGAAVAKRSSEGKVKFAIVDPRAQNASTHAEDWVPVKPGQDGAFAMGMMRWIIENKAYNSEYLMAPSPEAASAKEYACYVNATHLVIDDPSHTNNGKFLRLADLVLGEDEKAGETFIVLSAKDGSPVAYDRVDAAILDRAAIVKDRFGNEIRVKTAFRLMKESVMEHSLDDYARFADVPRKTIEKIARNFSSYGRKAAVCQYHGAGNYVSGTYAAYAIAALNAMVGSVEGRGGYMTSGGGAAKWDRGIYDMKKFPGKRKGHGVKISREKATYEKSTEYKNKKDRTGSGYPSKRPWFKFTKGGLSVESLSGIDEKYPYQCKVLFTYFYNPVYSTPGGYRYQDTLQSTDKVPLHVSIDTGINESNLYADYIVPDVTYLEGHYGWLSPHAPALRFTGVRTPAIEPLTGKTKEGLPFCLETFLIDLAKTMELPGFGEKAIPGKDGKVYPLNRAEDFYLRGFANIAENAKVAEASSEEQKFVDQNYLVSRYKDILTKSEWGKTSYVLARGGFFKKYEDVFDGLEFKRGVKRVVLYNEDLAAATNTLSGQRFHGTLKYLPPMDSAGNIIEEKDKEYPYYVITHKMNVHTQSRTNVHRWAMEIFPENFVVINESDAKDLEVKSGDRVKLLSQSNKTGIIGTAQVSKLVRPGCVGVSFHYGHTQLGASRLHIAGGKKVFLGGDSVMDGDFMIPDAKLGAGINPNMVTRLDENLSNTPMVDLVGGIPDFSSTRVKIMKA